MSNNTLALSGGNNYRLRVAGATTILGGYANIANNTDVSALILDGVISGSGMLNKTGATVNQRVLTINGTANTYSGGTNIIGGMVQVTGNSGNPLGTGPVKVFHGAELRIAGNGSLGAATLQTMSRVTGMGMVSLDNDFNPTVLTATNFSSAYGVVLGLNQPFFTTSLNMAGIGDGNAYLGGGLGAANVEYIAPSLGAGAGSTYRLTGGAGTLIFSGGDNVLTGANFVQFGNPLANTGTATTFGPGTVTLRNSNNYSLGSSIAKGTTVFLDQGASPGGSTPLGTGSVEIFGTLSSGTPGGFSGVGSFVNPATGANAQGVGGYILRPGGLITITDVAGTPPGGQGRWADTDPNGGALDLNGGTFRFTGAANFQSTEVVGTFNVSKNAGINVVRNASAGSATLTLGALTRSAGGTLAVTNTAATLGIPSGAASVTNFERLIVTGGVALGGATALGSGAVNSGIVAPWMVNAIDNSFMTYNPTASTTGFQSLVAGTPGTNQVGYSVPAATGTLNVGATATVDVTGNITALTGNAQTVHAMRIGAFTVTNGNTASTLTISSGGLILNGAGIVVNPVTTNVPLPQMILAFGGSEALIYSSAAATNAIVNAQINGTAGLTKFGTGLLQ
ncbi:MAG: hypothetical protein JNG86_10525, partial [Verrucomicrobiaceae bacterium]|nr:hypothetical protein [Verrucomicrobiaceae bacterium]